MKKIENLDQLRSEITRMRSTAKQQEQQLKDDFREIRDDLKPENILLNVLSSVTGIKINKSEFFRDGIAYGLSLILQRFVLKTEKKMENKVYNFMDSIFDRIQHVVKKFSGFEAQREERKEAQDDY